MKKSIASLAMLVSASPAMALIAPGSLETRQPNKYCLEVAYVEDDGSAHIGSCDATANNEELKKEILKNGCAADQVAMVTYKQVDIKACMPPGFAQL